MLKIAEHAAYILSSSIIMLAVVPASLHDFLPNMPMPSLIVSSIFTSVLLGVSVDILNTHMN